MVAATASVLWTTSFAAAQTSSAGPVALELDRDAETATWRFNENERSEQKKRTFTATPKLEDADFDRLDVGFPNDIENEDGRAFPEDNIIVKKRRSGPANSRDVEVIVTLNSADVAAGSYDGTLKVTGIGVAPSTLTVVATIRDSRLEALIFGVIGFLIGLALKAIVDVAAARKKNRAAGRWKPYWRRYFRDGAFWSNVAAGGVGAAGAIIIAYATDDTWGAGDLDELKVLGVALATAATGATLTDAVKPFQPTLAQVAG